VTINDAAMSRNRANDFRRTNSDSPDFASTGKYPFSFFFRTYVFIRLDPFYSTTINRATKTHPKKRSICKFKYKSKFLHILVFVLAHGSSLNNRSTIPIANIVVPREHF
jgi:hypothetical protein